MLFLAANQSVSKHRRVPRSVRNYLRPMSHAQKKLLYGSARRRRGATLSCNKVACATVNFPSENNRHTNFVSSDTDDDIGPISSALLITSTLY